MSDLATSLDRTQLEERRRALRALLRQPLLPADGPSADAFILVRRHAPWLRHWLVRHPDWRLELTSEFVRLRKVPATLHDGSRPAREPKEKLPFSRRRYVLLCLALAALERSERQTALGALADDILHLAAADEGLARVGMVFDLGSRDQRRDLVQVVRFLLGLQVLSRVHGDESQFLDRRGDVLYTIHRPMLAALPNVQRAPSSIDEPTLTARLEKLVEEPQPDSAEGRNRRIRSRLTRALLDDPVLYLDSLDDDELAYLKSQRATLTRQIHDATGLHPEVRAEGLAMVDERGDLTDLGLPEQGTDGHLTLLLAEHLAAHARAHRGDGPVRPLGLAALEQHVARLIRKHRKHWAKRVGEAGAETRLLAQTLDRLQALALVRRTPDGIVPLPAIGRFALDSDHPTEAP